MRASIRARQLGAKRHPAGRPKRQQARQRRNEGKGTAAAAKAAGPGYQRLSPSMDGWLMMPSRAALTPSLSLCRRDRANIVLG